MKCVRQSLQVMLKDPIDDMDMVEDTHKVRRVLSVQAIDVLGNHFTKAAIGPLFIANEVQISM